MFKKIIWATDGSAAADKALPVVQGLAAEGGASVEVVHVVEHLIAPGASGDPVHADEPEVKAKLEQQVADLGGGATLNVVAGHQRIAAHAIADAAKAAGADLIVVGTRGHTAVGSLVLGSVTQRLLHIAPCAVLAVPDHS